MSRQQALQGLVFGALADTAIAAEVEERVAQEATRQKQAEVEVERMTAQHEEMMKRQAEVEKARQEAVAQDRRRRLRS